MNVADRSRVTPWTLAMDYPPVLNESPGFPFHYCPKAGYFAVTTSFDPATYADVYFTWPGEGGTTDSGLINGNSGDWSTAIAWCDNPAMIIQPRQLLYCPDGFTAPNSTFIHIVETEDDPSKNYRPGQRYRMRLELSSGSIAVKIFEGDDAPPRNEPRLAFVYTNAGVFNPNHTFHFGYPPEPVRAALAEDNQSNSPRSYGIDNLKISRVNYVLA